MYYSQITPVLVEAIRELNLKIDSVSGLANQDSSIFGIFRTWLANATNGIKTIFTDKVQTKELCLDDVCVTKTQLQQLLQNQNINPQQDVTPPSTDVTPPSTDVTPPSTDVTPPSTDVTPPSTDVTPPSTDVTPPSTDVTPPSTDVTPPSTDVTPPSPSSES